MLEIVSITIHHWLTFDFLPSLPLIARIRVDDIFEPTRQRHTREVRGDVGRGTDARERILLVRVGSQYLILCVFEINIPYLCEDRIVISRYIISLL